MKTKLAGIGIIALMLGTMAIGMTAAGMAYWNNHCFNRWGCGGYNPPTTTTTTISTTTTTTTILLTTSTIPVNTNSSTTSTIAPTTAIQQGSAGYGGASTGGLPCWQCMGGTKPIYYWNWMTGSVWVYYPLTGMMANTGEGLGYNTSG